MTQSETATPSPVGEALVQIIDGDGEYNPIFDTALDSWQIKGQEFDYKVLSILGSQSGGKSTLLNYLFNTTFAVLDAKSGIHQTTLGIWVSPGDTKNILVFDVEGTDSKERGEENAAFERKTSLFSLAMSEILLINVNAKDIGCLKASNYMLLKFVLELNLQLFQKRKKTKTLLLFAVRDWDPDTPREKIETQLGTDMQVMWGEIQKPPEFVGSDFKSFFDLDFHLFHHYKYCKAEFLKDVSELRLKLTDPSHEHYLWNKSYTNDVAADDFNIYAKNVWEAVKENKDLDIPSQKEMLAMFRCEELANTAFDEFSKDISSIASTLRSGQTIENFGPECTDIVDKCMKLYTLPAARYHKEISTNKGKELLKQMKRELNTYYLDQLSKLRSSGIDQFEKKILQLIPESNEIVENFYEIITSASTEIIEHFTTQAASGIIQQAIGEWNYENELNDLKKSLERKINEVRENQLRRLFIKIEKEVKLNILEPLEDVLDNSDNNMWESIREIGKTGEKQVATTLEKYLSLFNCSHEDVENRVNELHKTISESVLTTIKKRTQGLDEHLMKKFKSSFQFCEKGLPRKWEKGLDIEAIYISSLESVNEIPKLFAINKLNPENEKYTIDDEDVPGEIVLLSKREINQLKTKFKSVSDVLFSNARTEQERNAVTTQIPAFMIVLLLVLGFNEIVWVISNPITLLFLLIAILAGIAIWYLNLGPIIFPVLQLALKNLISNVHNLMSPPAAPVKEKSE